MDPSLLLMLSNLLQLHNHLDPTTSLLSSTDSSSSPTTTLTSSSSAAPLLFFAIASVLTYASSSSSSSTTTSSSSLRRSLSLSPSPPPRNRSSFLLSPSRLFSLPPSSRDSRCRSLYGLSYPLLATLLDHLRPLPLSLPLPPDLALSLALSRLSRGLSSRSLARSLNLPPSLVSRATHSVTRLLSTHLYSDYVKIPSSHRLLQTTQSFKDLTSLPNLCGAIFSSPIRLPHRPATTDPLLLSSLRPFPSVLLQAVADNRKIFWDACVKAPGSSDPASHFRDSRLYARLVNNEILRDSIVTVQGHHVRSYIVGDSSYPLLSFLLTPFSPDPDAVGATAAQEAFDAAIMRGRAASVEAAIALLKGRWKILRNLNVGLDHAAQTVVACCVLHNMCQIAGEPEDESAYMWRDPPESPPVVRPLEGERSLYYLGESLRQALADDLHEKHQRLSAGGGAR